MTDSPKLKVLLADDHALVREGVRSSLVRFPFISVVGEASNGKEALRLCKALHPDIVLIDLNMPEMGGMEATPLIRKACPETKIIVLTVHDTKEYVFQLLRTGAHGYVLKDTSPDELVRAIQSVAKGDAFFSPGVSRILHEFVQSGDGADEVSEGLVSEREKEVLRMIAEGKTSKEVASQLNLSTRTVETYRVRLKRKLNARNLAELLKRAREEKLL
jgi:DNA-binding NarL/FixJ family response regulator